MGGVGGGGGDKINEYMHREKIKERKRPRGQCEEDISNERTREMDSKHVSLNRR